MCRVKTRKTRFQTGRIAHASFLVRNGSYVPGALMFAYALRQQKTKADLVCLVTDDVPVYARAPFELLFDHVVNVDRMMVSHPLRDRRTDRPFLFARLNALRLGLDGDLGFAYDKVALWTPTSCRSAATTRSLTLMALPAS